MRLSVPVLFRVTEPKALVETGFKLYIGTFVFIFQGCGSN